jgi:hypothetical protein
LADIEENRYRVGARWKPISRVKVADILAIVKGREQIAAGDDHDMDDMIKETID